jgi:putative membrane protein
MMWWNNAMSWSGWIVMPLTMVAFWALVIVVVLAIFRGDRDNRPPRATGRRDADQILDERFARGEIDIEEYRDRQDALRADR